MNQFHETVTFPQTETTNQQIKEVQKRTKTEEFEFPGSRSEQGYDSVATVNLAHE